MSQYEGGGAPISQYEGGVATMSNYEGGEKTSRSKILPKEVRKLIFKL